MIYLTSDKVKVIVLETANLEELAKGRPAKTPDGSVLIAWTPDAVWLADKLMECNGDAVKIGALIDEAAKRPQKPLERPKHEKHEHHFGGNAH